MINASQKVVYAYFTTATGKVGLNNAVHTWQALQGYIHPSVTLNWMAIAQDHGIKYKGDIDMQNGIATGAYSIAPTGPANFTLTAATEAGVIVGYRLLGPTGSISAEPLPGHTLELFYARNDNNQTTIQFDTDVLSTLSGHAPKINGVTMVLDVDWVVISGKTAAQSNTNYFPSDGTYNITWS